MVTPHLQKAGPVGQGDGLGARRHQRSGERVPGSAVARGLSPEEAGSEAARDLLVVVLAELTHRSCCYHGPPKVARSSGGSLSRTQDP